MLSSRLAIFTAVLFVATASQASAADKIWSATGVVNNGLATVVSCTNGGTVAASVTVALFKKDGTAGGTGTVSIGPKVTANFGSKAVVALGALESTLAAPIIQGGSLTITAPNGVYCIAFLIDPINDPPTVMSILPIVAKIKQKGV